MGGNYAMINAGIEPRISGLLLVSSSGFKFQSQSDPMVAEYMKSIVGDSYLPLLSGRPVVFLTATDDPVVTMAHVQDSFDKASEPKALLTIESDQHSYDDSMREILEQGISGW